MACDTKNTSKPHRLSHGRFGHRIRNLPLEFLPIALLFYMVCNYVPCAIVYRLPDCAPQRLNRPNEHGCRMEQRTNRLIMP